VVRRSLPTLAVIAVASSCVEPLQVLTMNPAPDAGQAFVVDQLSASQQNTCAIHAGELFCWGDNSNGQLGTGDLVSQLLPVRVGTDSDWAEVRIGYGASCARKTSGTVWCWGDNTQGQLGRGVAGGLHVPTQVSLSFSAKQIAFHFNHVCAISQSGELWCWGMNTEGELGLDESFYPTFNQLAPQQVAPDAGGIWKQVDTGQGHTCALHTDDSLWCWGRNSAGQLGLDAGASMQIHAPTRVGTGTDWSHVNATQNGSCGLKPDGTVWCWGYAYDVDIDDPNPQYGPLEVQADAGVVEVEIETFSICTRDASGHLDCWGRNVEGQLGTGDTTDFYSPKQIDDTVWTAGAMGRMHRCATKVGGAVYCTGQNSDGQLGTGDTNRRDVMTPIVMP
jgi:alpha-tubulin suppressor-like RCC1 family protein